MTPPEDHELENINELVAPAPVPQERRSNSLESLHLGRGTSFGNERAETLHSDRRSSQLVGHDEVIFTEQRPPDVGTAVLCGSTATSLLTTISYLIFFSFFGTLTRLVIQRLTLYPGAPATTSVLWANFAGSLVMGFLSEDTQLFRCDDEPSSTISRSDDNYATWKDEHTRRKKTVSLYIGLTTGYCGCVTSFSSFIRDVFLAISNDLDYPGANLQAPNGGYRFMATVGIIIQEIGLSLTGLFVGAHLAIMTRHWIPWISPKALKTVLDPIFVLLGPLAWLAVVFLVVLLPNYPHSSGSWAAGTWRGDTMFALVFSPLGCLARFYLSLQFNGRISSFPLGTFLANVGGTMTLGMAFALQHSTVPSRGPSTPGVGFVACQLLQGVMDGFCGCMTTVSTWVLELSVLRRGHSYIYGAASIGMALAWLVAIIGSLRWSKGFDTSACAAETG